MLKKLVIHESNFSIHGDHFIKMRIPKCLMWYATRIRQVAALLSYGEPQILEVFKNTLPNRLYWVLFPTEYLRQAVETAKRILTKEKIDWKLSGQPHQYDL